MSTFLERLSCVTRRSFAPSGRRSVVQVWTRKPRDPPLLSPKVKVTLTIWGRPVPVDLDYWQVDRV